MQLAGGAAASADFIFFTFLSLVFLHFNSTHSMFVESSLHGERAAVCQLDAPLDPVVLSSVNEPDVSGWLSCFALV